MHAVQYVSIRSPSKWEDMSLNRSRWRQERDRVPRLDTNLLTQSGRLTQGLDWLKINTAQAYRYMYDGRKEWWKQHGGLLIVLRESRDVREGLDACVGAIPWVHDRGDPNHSTIIRIRMYMYLTF